MVAAAAGIAVVVFVAVAFAIGRPTHDASGVSADERQTATAWVAHNSQMWTWMQSHWDEMVLMHQHWGDTAWMQTHLADWSWMRDHWEAMAWMHTNWQRMAWMHTGGMMGVAHD